ncbi:MAG: hypothetical protein PUK21_01735 [Peptostreptococcaceae bacterium]|nr:hypothetical protein [Peptostreptococcaceae bacterium]MDY5738730.1 hypothetical protein [Anaerovoracaceae bacterium]
MKDKLYKAYVLLHNLLIVTAVIVNRRYFDLHKFNVSFDAISILMIIAIAINYWFIFKNKLSDKNASSVSTALITMNICSWILLIAHLLK